MSTIDPTTSPHTPAAPDDLPDLLAVRRVLTGCQGVVPHRSGHRQRRPHPRFAR